MTERDAEVSPETKTSLAPSDDKKLVSRWTFDQRIAAIQTGALVVGIIIAIYQSAKLRESIDTSTWSSVAQQLTEIDKQFIDNEDFISMREKI